MSEIKMAVGQFAVGKGRRSKARLKGIKCFRGVQRPSQKNGGVRRDQTWETRGGKGGQGIAVLGKRGWTFLAAPGQTPAATTANPAAKEIGEGWHS